MPKPTTLFAVVATILLLGAGAREDSFAQTVFDSEFSKGDFAALGWKADAGWDEYAYADVSNNPGKLARFAANKPPGSLTRSFAEIKRPRTLTLSLDYGWGWGDAGQGADSVSFMLLDPKRNGYAFKLHRTKATWAVQWGRVAGGSPDGEMHWAPVDIDVTQRSVRDGGGLSHLNITREADGTWSMSSKAWNAGTGAMFRFSDATTSSFNQLVLTGTENFDEQVFNHVVLTATSPDPVPTTAVPAAALLDSIGIDSTFPDRGQPLDKTIEMIKFCGFRWVRGGIEGVSTTGPTTTQTYLDLHKQTGVRFSWGLVSGGTDINKLIETATPIAEAGALLAFEGNNEPNNWGVTYQGEKGGGGAPSWLAVAKLQRDMYAAVKADPKLKNYPVWSISENGAEIDNVGLQFLKIPAGAGTVMPEGTRYADAANVHNYIYHAGSPAPADNKTWNAADPTSACRVDGLYANYGLTWAKHFSGYSESELVTLPKVTTETGCTIDGQVTEELQALNLLSMYLDQFKRGWSHTAVYLLRDRTDEAGNQSFGFFKPDYTPRKAATYLHNLTTILADPAAPSGSGSPTAPGQLKYSIPELPPTVHDLLLQKSDGSFYLLVWNERLQGSDDVMIRFGETLGALTMFDPTVGTNAVASKSGVDSLKLTLSDHPLVITIGKK